LAHGLSYVVLAQEFLVGVSTVKQIVDDVCQPLFDELSPELLPFPSEEKWKEIEADYRAFWNHPLCIGALDGKHFQCEVIVYFSIVWITFSLLNYYIIILMAKYN
jgi:hypothetical protein